MNPILLFPDFAIIALGYVLRRTWLQASAWETIEKLVYYVLFPCLLFYSVVKSPVDLHDIGLFALGGGVVIAGAFLAGAIPWLWSRMGRVEFASGLQIAYRFNSYIALALVSRVAGQEGVANMAMLLAVGVPLCNILAVATMSQGSGVQAFKDMLKNPLILGTVLGIAAKWFGLPIPQALTLTLERLAQAAVSLGLLAVGAGLMFSGLRGNWVVSVWWLAVRLLGAPVLAVLYAKAAGLPAMQTTVLLVFSAIPSASSAYILATRMGGNAALVACLISLSTVGAAFTLPLVFAWFHP